MQFKYDEYDLIRAEVEKIKFGSVRIEIRDGKIHDIITESRQRVAEVMPKKRLLASKSQQ